MFKIGPKRDSFPPGPSGWDLLRARREARRDRLGFFQRCVREYGAMVSFPFLARRVYIITDPEAIETVLVSEASKFSKGIGLQLWGTRRIFGNGLITSEGDFWRRQRRLAQPAFHRERIANYSTVAVNAAERMLDGWRGPVDLQRELLGLTMRVVTKTLFDSDVSGEAAEVAAVLDSAIELFTVQFTLRGALAQYLPTPERFRLERVVASLDRIVYRLIEEHRGKDRGDLLSMLMAARDEDGSRMTDQQLRDEAITLFLAGHETTATALCWTWILLMEHPEVERRLRQEVDSVLGGRAPTYADLSELRYTEQVIRESMRIHPPVWTLGRQAREPVTVGGYVIPRGSQILIPQYIVHREPRFFPAPEKFLPERWTEGFIRELPKFAYFPFGGGARVCIGSAFAMMEAMLILATMCRRTGMRRVASTPIVPFPSITLRPTGNLSVEPLPRS